MGNWFRRLDFDEGCAAVREALCQHDFEEFLIISAHNGVSAADFSLLIVLQQQGSLPFFASMSLDSADVPSQIYVQIALDEVGPPDDAHEENPDNGRQSDDQVMSPTLQHDEAIELSQKG